MSTPSQGLRALGSLLEAVAPEFSDAARAALGDVGDRLHAAADAEAATEANRVGGAVAGPALAVVAAAMVDGFFATLRAPGIGRRASSALASPADGR